MYPANTNFESQTSSWKEDDFEEDIEETLNVLDEINEDEEN